MLLRICLTFESTCKQTKEISVMVCIVCVDWWQIFSEFWMIFCLFAYASILTFDVRTSHESNSIATSSRNHIQSLSRFRFDVFFFSLYLCHSCVMSHLYHHFICQDNFFALFILQIQFRVSPNLFICTWWRVRLSSVMRKEEKKTH